MANSMIDNLGAGGAGPDAGPGLDAGNKPDALAAIKDLVAQLTDAVAKLDAEEKGEPGEPSSPDTGGPSAPPGGGVPPQFAKKAKGTMAQALGM